MSLLVIDIGTSGIRAAIVHPDATVTGERHVQNRPEVPFAGLVEFDAARMADIAIETATAVLAAHGPVEAVGIATQRASTVVWDRATGVPVGPALGWQDLRTIIECLTANAEGFRLAPNQSATKVAWLLDTFDAERRRDLCVGTVDSYLIWRLTGGQHHVTDLTNASVTGLLRADGTGWDDAVLERFRIDPAALPRLVDSSGPIGPATALPGAPMIAGVAGDQQASLLGQGCVRPGLAKITFGTGGMFDAVVGPQRSAVGARGQAGTFPIVAWQLGGVPTWGIEAIMLSAGSCVDWLRDDLGIIATSAQSHDVAQTRESSGGVVFVPALLGLGTPVWDYGARGLLIGLTRGSGRAEICRAVLEGVAHRGTDLVEAAMADTGLEVPLLRIDGGMSANPTFVQALANASGRPVEVSPVLEATTLGAAFLAGLAVGTWANLDEVGAAWRPGRIVEPDGTLDRGRWAEAVERSKRWEPELSALDF